MQVVQAIVQSGLAFFDIFILCSKLEQMEQLEDVWVSLVDEGTN